MYLPGREHKCILPTSTVRAIFPKSKISPRITVGELQKLVVSWGHQISNNYNQTPLPYQKAIWKACQKKVSLVIKPQKPKNLELNIFRTLNQVGNRSHYETKIRFLAINTRGVSDIKRGIFMQKRTQSPLWWWILDGVGLFSVQWYWEPCQNTQLDTKTLPQVSGDFQTKIRLPLPRMYLTYAVTLLVTLQWPNNHSSSSNC